MDLKEVVAALDMLVLERLPDGRFVRRAALPSWCLQLSFPEIRAELPFDVNRLLPFLGTFVESAERVWSGGVAGPVYSAFWSQSPALHLQAHALKAGDTQALLITRDEQLFHEQQRILQRARELRLTNDALLREIEQKDVLLHTVVDELTSPLHNMLGMLSLLEEASLKQPVVQWVHGALEAARHQKQLIGEVLEVFSAERYPPRIAGADAPDVHEVVREVVAGLASGAVPRNVRLEASLDAADPCHVACDRRRLARIVSNLGANALNRSPQGGRVRVTARKEGNLVTICAEDEGPTIAVERLARLFDKLAPDHRANLGLYFCRITAERLGGAVGYEPIDHAGARFWVRLQTVAPPNAEP